MKVYLFRQTIRVKARSLESALKKLPKRRAPKDVDMGEPRYIGAQNGVIHATKKKRA